MSDGMILKDLGAVLSYAKNRFQNEFVWQDICLNDIFKSAFRGYLEKKHCSITYFDHTSVITTKIGQNIFVANQWFAIGSYLVDFCTELLTYRESFLSVCKRRGNDPEIFAKSAKNSNLNAEKDSFIRSAYNFFSVDFFGEKNISKAAQNLWRFVSDYSWWSGSKTIDRNDFYVSPVLNSLNIVNVSHGFVADLVFAYSTDFNLRRIVDSLEKFTIGARLNKYTPDSEERNFYRIAEEKELADCVRDSQITYNASSEVAPTISISLASLARFKNGGV